MHKQILIVLLIAVVGCSLPFSEKSAEDSQTSDQQQARSTQGQNCNNELLPMKVGASWTYKINYQQKQMQSVEMTKTIISAEGNSFTVKRRFTSAELPTATNLEGKIECINGDLKSYDLGSSNVSLSDEQDFQATGKIQSVEGIWLPAKVKQGDKWSYTADIQINKPISEKQFGQPKGRIVSNCIAQGKETITVAAGTFEAIKVTCNLDLTTKFGDVETLTTVIQNSWFAPGVGEVKSTSSVVKLSTLFKGKEQKLEFPGIPDFSSGHDKPTEIELISYNIP
jgi:hypothetical protein